MTNKEKWEADLERVKDNPAFVALKQAIAARDGNGEKEWALADMLYEIGYDLNIMMRYWMEKSTPIGMSEMTKLLGPIAKLETRIDKAGLKYAKGRARKYGDPFP